MFKIISIIPILFTTCYATSNSSLVEKEIETTQWDYLPLYIIGVVYLFVAIAILCDEFFVPSLELIASSLNLSRDVAGATLMAAGGSAPELFTSLISTFRQSSLGFSTIVGSAVFNILFVIFMCVWFAPKPLKLTWWPLVRDMTYYTFSLIMITIVFVVISPNQIEWWEALILFNLYIGYVVIMKNNDLLYETFTGEKLEVQENNQEINPITWRAGVWRQGLIDFLTSDSQLAISTKMVTKIAGEVDTTFNTIDKDSNGFIDKNEFSQALQQIGDNSETSEIDVVFQEIDQDNNGKIDKKEFTIWYLASVNRIRVEIDNLFKNASQNSEGDNINRDDLSIILTQLKLEIKPDKVYQEMGLETQEITLELFQNWYEKSIFWQDHLDKNQGESQLSQGIDLSIPQDNIWDQIKWLLTIPLMFVFSYTIPDVNKPKNAKYKTLSFIMSVAWIGLVSYFMVDWVEIIGNTIGIPINVMGLTFLAAGTSVPDLISSVVVTKQGHGDMAVSSSIGSNIFDILVGLPVPWLLFSIVNKKAVVVTSSNLAISLVVLILMLVFVLITIKWCQFEMNKKMGFTMLFLYLVFIVQDLARCSYN